MKHYQKYINEISNICINDKNHNIIIGSNASGKTDVIKSIFEGFRETMDCYLVDSVNKKFNIAYVKVEGENVIPNLKRVLDVRIEPDVLNIKDVFADGPIENIIGNTTIKNEFEKTLSDYFDKEVRFLVEKKDNYITGTDVKYIKFGDKTISELGLDEVRLSDGQQSIFRLLLELIYYRYMVKNSTPKVIPKIVLIDEIDTYLDKNNSQKIFNFISEKFNDFRFIITTHSVDVLFGTKKANIIAMVGNSNDTLDYYRYSAEDIDTISAAESIIGMTATPDVMHIKEVDEDELVLSRLFNHAISDIFRQEDYEIFEGYAKKELTNTNKLLYLQIKQIVQGFE